MHPLAQKVTSLQRRIVRRERAAAACRIAAAVLGAALLLGFIDYVVRFSDPGLRILATAALAAAALGAAYRWWYLPRLHELSPLFVARRVEARFPDLRDALASAWEFLQQPEDDRLVGSAQLRRLVISETQEEIDRLPLDDVIDRRPLRRAAGWLVVPVAVLTACLAFDPQAVATAAVRLLAPINSLQWPRQHHLLFRDVPARLAAGQTFEVELIDAAGDLPDEVRIAYRSRHDGRRELTSEPMIRAGDTMIARRENVRHSFAFRAVGGDDDTMRWHHVEVIEPPRLESLNIVLHPPAYAGLESGPSQRHLNVLIGTGIEMHGRVDRPVAAARILLDEQSPIDATPDARDIAGDKRRTFHIAPSQWIAAETGPYRLELTDDHSVTVVAGQWNLRVHPDTPPSISWQRPNDDLFVTPSAVVPIEVLVKDNLAIERVELVLERSDRSESERERQPTERIELHRGPQRPPVLRSSDITAIPGESRVVKHDWDLAPLELPAGAQLTIQAEAADYRPATARTGAPRHITIVTAEEIEIRWADRLAQIVRQLERALVIQRPTRDEVRRLEIQQREAELMAADRGLIRSAELNQRRVSKVLVDPIEGALGFANSLVIEIDMNRVASSDVRTLLVRLVASLNGLRTGPLDLAERELTNTRTTIETIAFDDAERTTGDETRDSAPAAPPRSTSSAEAPLRSLSTAGAAQDEIIATLERLIIELSSKADYRRFARLLAELKEDQIAHQLAARRELNIATLPLQAHELSRAQRVNLSKASASQSALAARFEKIEQGIDELARQLADDQTDIARTLTEAVELARRLAIGSKMYETALDLNENRLGQALARELQIADDLQRVIDVLRGRQPRDPDQFVDELRKAEQRLAELREQLSELRKQNAEAVRQRQQAALRTDIEQLAQRLERLQAPDAGESAHRAASRLDNESAPKNGEQAPSQKLEKAEQDLEKAARQLAERRQQAEDDLALEFVRRFQQQLGEMVERQKRVIDQTIEANNKRQATNELSKDLSQAIQDLAGEERRLAEKAREHGELLFGLGAVRVSLEEAERRLTAAAERLEQLDTGPPAQRAERHAMARLEGMMQAFAQTSNDAAQNPQPPAGAGPAPAADQPPRRPTFELLEIKMLRLLQADLNERTAAYRQRIAKGDRPLAEGQAELAREASELAAEQRRLAELVENMLTRDNGADE